MKLVRLIISTGSLAGLLLIALIGGAAAESGRIAAVRIAPDLANLELALDGQIGRHLTHVLNSPNRLVIDFESAVLGKLPARIKVGRGSVNEIRLGQHDSRARLVIDFGQNRVPRFNVLRQKHSVMIDLRNGQTMGTQYAANSTATPAVRTVRPTMPSSGAMPGEKKESRVSVTQAGVTDDGVVMELADRKEPKKAYRLNIDLDKNTLEVNRASLSDAAGNLNQSRLMPSQAAVPVMTAGSLRPSVGPKKDWENSAAQPERRSQFKWGARTSGPSNSEKPRVISKGPFKMNEYVVQRRSAAH